MKFTIFLSFVCISHARSLNITAVDHYSGGVLGRYDQRIHRDHAVFICTEALRYQMLSSVYGELVRKLKYKFVYTIDDDPRCLINIKFSNMTASHGYWFKHNSTAVVDLSINMRERNMIMLYEMAHGLGLYSHGESITLQIQNETLFVRELTSTTWTRVWNSCSSVTRVDQSSYLLLAFVAVSLTI